MRRTNKIESRWRKSFRLYPGLLFICFVGVYLLAYPYDIIQFCEDGVHYFDDVECGRRISPLIVQMNAETLDARVASLMPPLSYTEGVGYHLLGTDALGRDVFAGILYGGQRSLLIGLLSGGLAMVLGWSIGLGSVYIQWSRRQISFLWLLSGLIMIAGWLTHSYVLVILAIGLVLFRLIMRQSGKVKKGNRVLPWFWSRGMEWYQALPDLLFLLVLSAAIGVLNIWGLGLIIILVIWPSLALVARRVGMEVSQKPYFRQALRNQVSGKHLFFHYLWGNTRSTFRAIFPLVVARVILLEATISFLGLGLPPDLVTIGSMIAAARHNMSAWWLIVFSGLFIFILVYPLLLSGRQSGEQRTLNQQLID